MGLRGDVERLGPGGDDRTVGVAKLQRFFPVGLSALVGGHPDAVAQPESPCVLVNLPPDRFDAVRLYDQNGELRATALQITPVP